MPKYLTIGDRNPGATGSQISSNRDSVRTGLSRIAASGHLATHVLGHISSSVVAALVVTLLVTACSLIAPYDQAAYDKATATKAEALALMDKASGSYSAHLTQIDEVSLDIEKAYEYDRGRASNVETVKMWELVRDPDGHLFGHFLRRWRDRETLHAEYIKEKKKDVADAFDQIIALERGKPKPKSE